MSMTPVALTEHDAPELKLNIDVAPESNDRRVNEGNVLFQQHMTDSKALLFEQPGQLPENQLMLAQASIASAPDSQNESPEGLLGTWNFIKDNWGLFSPGEAAFYGVLMGAVATGGNAVDWGTPALEIGVLGIVSAALIAKINAENPFDNGVTSFSNTSVSSVPSSSASVAESQPFQASGISAERMRSAASTSIGAQINTAVDPSSESWRWIKDAIVQMLSSASSSDELRPAMADLIEGRLWQAMQAGDVPQSLAGAGQWLTNLHTSADMQRDLRLEAILMQPSDDPWAPVQAAISEMVVDYPPSTQPILTQLTQHRMWQAMESGSIPQTMEGARQWLTNLYSSHVTTQQLAEQATLVDQTATAWSAMLNHSVDLKTMVEQIGTGTATPPQQQAIQQSWDAAVAASSAVAGGIAAISSSGSPGGPNEPEDDPVVSALINAMTNVILKIPENVNRFVQGENPESPTEIVNDMLISMTVGALVPGGVANNRAGAIAGNALEAGIETELRQAAGLEEEDPANTVMSVAFGAVFGELSHGVGKLLKHLRPPGGMAPAGGARQPSNNAFNADTLTDNADSTNTGRLTDNTNIGDGPVGGVSEQALSIQGGGDQAPQSGGRPLLPQGPPPNSLASDPSAKPVPTTITHADPSAGSTVEEAVLEEIVEEVESPVKKLTTELVPYDLVTELLRRAHDMHIHMGGSGRVFYNYTQDETSFTDVYSLGAGSYNDINQMSTLGALLRNTSMSPQELADGARYVIQRVPQSTEGDASRGIAGRAYYMMTGRSGGLIEVQVNVLPNGNVRVPQIVEADGQVFPGGLYLAEEVQSNGGYIPLRNHSNGLVPMNLVPELRPWLTYKGLQRDMRTMDDIMNLSPELRPRVTLGLVSGDPASPVAALQIDYALKYANELDPRARHINLAFGETTLVKEGVIPYMLQAYRPSLTDPLKVKSIHGLLDKVGEVGGAIVVHADSSTAPTLDRLVMHTQSNYENLDPLIDIFQQHSDIEGIIWAHGGGLGRTIRPGPDHDEQVRRFLTEVPNGYIDMSWSVITNYLRDPALRNSLIALVNEFPDRFMYGSDSLGQSAREKVGEAMQTLVDVGFIQGLDEPEKFLWGNADRVFGQATENINNWRVDNAEYLRQLPDLVPDEVNQFNPAVQDLIF